MSNIIGSWITQWLQGETVRVLGLTLVHFLWEGLGLALLLFTAMAFCRRAQVRYALGVCTLSAMLVTPFVTFAVLSRSPQPATTFSSTRSPVSLDSVTSAPSESFSHAPVLPESFPAWCACAWLIGVFAFSLRTLGGWLVLARLRRECTRSLPPEFIQKFRMLERRLSLKQRIRYLQSKLVETPSVVGWLRPVVLLPFGALSGLSAEQLEAVIVHELAHIRRLDGIVNLFQIASETLFFYHPAVWWVNKIIREERENCCDDVSVEICGNAVEYAKALTLLESARATPTLALFATGGDLKARVLRLISPERTAAAASTMGLGLLGVLCMTSALLTAAAIAKADVGPGHPYGIVLQLRTQGLPTPSPPAAPSDINEVPVPPVVPSVAIGTSVAAPAPSITNEELAQAPAPPLQSKPLQPASSSQPAGSYIEGLKAAGLKDLTVDGLVELKIQGVTPEYVAQMHRNGFDPNVHELIGMMVQGITPDYVKEVRATGLNPSMHDLIGMKVQGITPAYVREIQNSGLGQVKVHDVIAMKVQDVTPEYVRGIRATGLNPTLHDLIGMKVQGVTPEYVRVLQAAGLGDIKVHDCINAKVQDVTPDFIEKVKSHGFKNLTLHQLIALKNTDVF
jgi:beta-lactamase regulating signal transducer with metallopeptidase domain